MIIIDFGRACVLQVFLQKRNWGITAWWWNCFPMVGCNFGCGSSYSGKDCRTGPGNCVLLELLRTGVSQHQLGTSDLQIFSSVSKCVFLIAGFIRFYLFCNCRLLSSRVEQAVFKSQ